MINNRFKKNMMAGLFVACAFANRGYAVHGDNVDNPEVNPAPVAAAAQNQGADIALQPLSAADHAHFVALAEKNFQRLEGTSVKKAFEQNFARVLNATEREAYLPAYQKFDVRKEDAADLFFSPPAQGMSLAERPANSAALPRPLDASIIVQSPLDSSKGLGFSKKRGDHLYTFIVRHGFTQDGAPVNFVRYHVEPLTQEQQDLYAQESANSYNDDWSYRILPELRGKVYSKDVFENTP